MIPAVNQVELHPGLRQTELLSFAATHGIHCVGYSPLATGAAAFAVGEGEGGRAKGTKVSLLQHPVVERVAKRVGRTPAQVVLRWGIQRGTCVVPKSVHPGRIRENLQVGGFMLGEEEMRELGGIEPQVRMVPGERSVSPEGWYPTVEELWK